MKLQSSAGANDPSADPDSDLLHESARKRFRRIITLLHPTYRAGRRGSLSRRCRRFGRLGSSGLRGPGGSAFGLGPRQTDRIDQQDQAANPEDFPHAPQSRS